MNLLNTTITKDNVKDLEKKLHVALNIINNQFEALLFNEGSVEELERYEKLAIATQLKLKEVKKFKKSEKRLDVCFN